MSTVALFPLRTVLVPGLVLPLHIFEPRYRMMIRMLSDLPEDERRFGIVAIRPGEDPASVGRDGLYDVGTIARVTSVDALPDGRLDIMTVGVSRFRLGELDCSMPFTRATVQEQPEPLGDPQRAGELAVEAVELLAEYRERIAAWQVIEMAPLGHLPDDPVVLSYLVGAAVVTDLPARQALLAIPDAQTRLAAVCRLLRREISMMSRVPSLPAVDLAEARPACN